MEMYIVYILHALLAINILLLIVTNILLPSSVNKSKLDEGYHKTTILNIPEMYSLEWYDPKRYWVRKLLIINHLATLLNVVVIIILGK
jgi:hypothetical protein